MGCRVSVQFAERIDGKTEKSGVLYHHWAGNELVKAAKKFLIGMYKKDLQGAVRSGVNSLLFNFIQYCFEKDHFSLNTNNSAGIYDPDDTEGSDDCGHYLFQVKEDNFTMKHTRGRWQNEPVITRGKKGF